MKHCFCYDIDENGNDFLPWPLTLESASFPLVYVGFSWTLRYPPTFLLSLLDVC